MKLVNSTTEFLYKTAWLINIVTVRYIPDAIMKCMELRWKYIAVQNKGSISKYNKNIK